MEVSDAGGGNWKGLLMIGVTFSFGDDEDDGVVLRCVGDGGVSVLIVLDILNWGGLVGVMLLL